MASRRPDSDSVSSRITDLRLTSPLCRAPLAIGFHAEAFGDASIVAVRVAIAHRAGVVTRLAPAAQLGIREPRGKGRISLEAGRIPSGPAAVVLTPIDGLGQAGQGARIELEIPSGGCPTDPGTLHLDPLAPTLQRPTGEGRVHVRCRVRRKGNEAVSLFVTLHGPDGRCDTFDLPAPANQSTLTLTSLTSADAGGRYRIVAVLVGPDGTMGPATEAAIHLVGRGGQPAPEVKAVVPASKRHLLEVRGRGFSAEGLTVTFGPTRVAVHEVSDRKLLVAPPDDLDAPVPVTVATVDGIGVSAAPWTPPVSIRLVPETFSVAEGGSYRLQAVVRGGGRRRRVVWSINGKAEGIRVDRRGIVTVAVSDRPREFTVVATVDGVQATALGTITGTVDRPAKRATVGRLGGTVRSLDGGASLEIPSGALGKLGQFGIEPVVVVGRGRAGRGPLVVAEARLSASQRQLDKPALLRLPLSLPLDPDTKVRFRGKDHGNRDWRDLDWDAILNGRWVGARLERVPNWIQVLVDVDWDVARPAPQVVTKPIINGLEPNTLDEGVTAAILVTGANFVPGLTEVQFLTATGAVESRIEARTKAVTADGRQLGVALKVGVMTDLGEGSSRPITVRVVTPAGMAETTLWILGHDELDVSNGTRTVVASGTFSRMQVDGTGRLQIANAVPPISVDCFEIARVASTHEAGGGLVVLAGNGGRGNAGTNGGAAGGGGGGAVPAGHGSGGNGGAGATGAGGRGGDGSPGRTAVTLTRAGAGGTGGVPGGGGPFPHQGGTGGNGTPGRRGIGSFAEPTFEPSPGGGGGGGGGGEGWIFQTTGAGGGGGGGGGGAFSLSAGEAVEVEGDIVAAGGNGAFGERAIAGSTDLFTLIKAGDGGGGGGGAGGLLWLRGVRYRSGMVVAVEGVQGQPPRYGPPGIEARTLFQQMLDRTPSGTIAVEGETPLSRGALWGGPDLPYVRDLLATAPAVDVATTAADAVRVRGASLQPALFNNVGSNGVVTVTLQPGFNEVEAVWTGASGLGPVLQTCAPIRKRVFLFLPNTIPFYEFTIAVTPGTAVLPTERSLALTAAVTSRPATPSVDWDIGPGSPLNAGSILRTGAFSLRYTAPCEASAQPVIIRAKSSLDPSRGTSASITVVPGIEVSATAPSGTPADPTLPSLNPYQVLTISIPAAVAAQWPERFGVTPDVEFERYEATPQGGWAKSRTPVAGASVAGMTALTVELPPRATPVQRVRVPGHGCTTVQVVPIIHQLDPATATFPQLTIRGAGFAPGETTVIYISGAVAPSDLVQVTPDTIVVAHRPPSGSEIRVRTPGGTSAGAVMP
ncbi:MAG: IPT/TIG domain-containing protein [Gemmatimonadales bacterium]|nr:IPT/TIG domain-containing protein [Gemmatimonadales bacterium]